MRKGKRREILRAKIAGRFYQKREGRIRAFPSVFIFSVSFPFCAARERAFACSFFREAPPAAWRPLRFGERRIRFLPPGPRRPPRRLRRLPKERGSVPRRKSPRFPPRPARKNSYFQSRRSRFLPLRTPLCRGTGRRFPLRP